jgi:phosphoribosylaminoimidazole-succinocarboxamide synthase
MGDALRDQLLQTLGETAFSALGERYRGKVRDNYRQKDRYILITTDRISAFDHVLGTIPFKGEALNRLAVFWFEKTKDVAPNHLLDVPDPNVMVAKLCQPLPIEVIVRGYLTGSLWRDYEAGKAGAYGIEFPKGLKKDQAFERPIITPSTKAEQGKHDEAISARNIVAKGLVDQKRLDEAFALALALFARGQESAKSRGLILVDTKYEFGISAGKLLVIDEIHTMDSSRYWEAREYADRFRKGDEQKMLDKENVRQWLIRERNYKGDGPPPKLPDDVRIDIARIYLNAFERITGSKFEPKVGPVLPRIEANLRAKGYLP